MEIGKQIKKYRGELGFSQDMLSEKIYVSRQTISNWENDKSYPDINSLLRLSEIFQVSIDILIKGDVEKMEEEIKKEDQEQFRKDSFIFGILLLMVIVTPIPLLHYLNNVGIAIWIVVTIVAIVFAVKVEKVKKTFDIQTYKEILAFTEGKRLDALEKVKEEGKRPYQKVLLALGSGFITFVIAVLMIWFLG
jgi:transcriptional regulator with XRE-family HTH domain